ncbi:membrane protein [soil metagenome]
MTTAEISATRVATTLRSLYFTRFGFAITWAILFLVAGTDIGLVGGTLLVLYPLFDVAAAIFDARSSKTAGPVPALYLNIALSLLTVAGLVIAATSGRPAVLRVWGAWAITAGIVQLIVAINRRKLGGQWAMILSGSISTLAGTGFIVQASSDDPSLSNLAGYATLGGIFFLISALRLRRAATGD